MNDLNAKLKNINSRIAAACQKTGRCADEIRVVAVSKRQTADKIRQLHALGQLAFGENYVQEALQKQAELADLELEWHFIGPVQSNKTREIATHFSWVQSVDRAKILYRLSQQRPAGLAPLNVCLQVNIDREEQKSGAWPDEIPDLARLCSTLPGLRLRGLMAIPRIVDQGGSGLNSFQKLNQLYTRLREDGLTLDTLSIGMSSDFDIAIHAGSTMVRIGTDLFGSRD